MIVPYFRLENFRNHVDSVLKIGDARFVVIRGGNHDGKSSIAQGFSMCLTPTTEGLNPKGDGFESKIRRGQDKATLTMHIQGQHLIERKVGIHRTSTGRTKTNKCLDDPEWHPLPFEQFLEYMRVPMGIVLNTDYFLSLDADRQSKVLASLVLPAQYDFPEDKVKSVESMLGQGAVDFSVEPFTAIASAYRKLYKERETVNRQVKDFSMPGPLSVPQGVTSEGIQKEIETTRTARQKVLHERSTAEEKARDAIAKRSKLEGQIQSNKTRVAEEQGRLSRANQEILGKDKHREFTELAAKKARLDELSVAHFAIEKEIPDLKRSIQHYETLDTDSECETCGQKIAKKHVESVLNYFRTTLQQKIDGDREIFDEIKTLGGVEDAIHRLQLNDAAIKNKEAIESIISEKTKLIKSDEVKLDKMEKAPNTVEQFKGPLDEVDAKMQGLQDQLRPIIAAEERAKEIERLKAELKILQGKATTLDNLVKYFDTDGIRAQLLAEYIGKFKDRLNAVMDAWGYSCSFSIDPFEFTVKDDHGVETPIRELSGSEKLMFSVALQCAVAQLAEIEFIVADRMDTLLPDERAKAYRCLFQMLEEKTLKQAFLIVSDETTTIPELDGSAFFMVRDGSVTRL